MRSRLRHPLRFFSRVMVLRWAWRNRHDLTRWARFAMRLPTEVRTRDRDDLVTEARARIALSADPRTRNARDLDIVGYENGSLNVRAPADQPLAQVVRDVLTPISGVTDIHLVDDRPAIDTVSTPSPAPPPREDRTAPSPLST